MTFSEQFIYAMIKPGKYKELLELKKSRSVLFAVVLTVMLGIIGYAIPVAAVISGFGGFEKLFGSTMSPMVVENGQMQIEQPFFMTVGNLKFVINTQDDRVADERLVTEGAYVAVGKKEIRLAISGGGKVTDYVVYKVSDFFPNGFSNDSLKRMIPRIYAILILSFVVSCLGYFIKYAFLSLVFSITVNAMNKHFQLGLSFGQVFMLCFYGQTLGIIISNFNSALNLLPQMIVSFVCVLVSIRMITTAIVVLKGPPDGERR